MALVKQPLPLLQEGAEGSKSRARRNHDHGHVGRVLGHAEERLAHKQAGGRLPRDGALEEVGAQALWVRRVGGRQRVVSYISVGSR